MGERIRIDRLRLRMEGTDPSAAKRLGSDVARQLANELASAEPQSIARLHLRVPTSTNSQEIVRRIAAALPKRWRV